jgi:hypothetical protein
MLIHEKTVKCHAGSRRERLHGLVEIAASQHCRCQYGVRFMALHLLIAQNICLMFECRSDSRMLLLN